MWIIGDPEKETKFGRLIDFVPTYTCKVSAKDAANEGEGENDKETNARDGHHRTKGDRPENNSHVKRQV